MKIVKTLHIKHIVRPQQHCCQHGRLWSHHSYKYGQRKTLYISGELIIRSFPLINWAVILLSALALTHLQNPGCFPGSSGEPRSDPERRGCSGFRWSCRHLRSEILKSILCFNRSAKLFAELAIFLRLINSCPFAFCEKCLQLVYLKFSLASISMPIILWLRANGKCISLQSYSKNLRLFHFVEKRWWLNWISAQIFLVEMAAGCRPGSDEWLMSQTGANL